MKYIDQVIEELAAKANHTYTPKQLMDIKEAIVHVASDALVYPNIQKVVWDTKTASKFE